MSVFAGADYVLLDGVVYPRITGERIIEANPATWNKVSFDDLDILCHGHITVITVNECKPERETWPYRIGKAGQISLVRRDPLF